jgi:hypothetical protein
MTTTEHEGEVHMRWLPGLGGSPGGLDLSVRDAQVGTRERAVSVFEALAICAMIDLFCPGSRLYERVCRLVAYPFIVPEIG